ncbi:MAG: glycosyltransferase [Bacteroidia bacterium]|nr:glycosyltransferase [Bacteroidia bacterium]
MNIIFYAESGFNPKNGGIERVSHMLSNEFISLRHQVFFVSRYPGPPDEQYTPAVPQLILPNQKKICSTSNIAEFTDFVKKNMVDIIICQHSYNKDFTTLPYLVKQKTGVKILYSIHTTPNYQTITLEAATKSKPILPSEKSIARQYRRIMRIVFKQQKIKSKNKKMAALLNLLNKFGDGVVLLSEKYIPITQHISGLTTTDKLFAINNPNTYISSEIDTTIEKENSLLFVGRLTTEKHPEKAMLLWQRIQNRFPDWNLKIVGAGKLEKDLQILKNKLNLQRCFIEGRRDPKPYYEKSKILLLPSDMEGFPMVVTEAMQHGVVPIVFNTFEALSDIIDDNISGISIEPYNLDEFEQKLTTLMKNEEKCEQMANAGRKSVKKFALQNIAKQWEELFDKIITDKTS